MSITHDLMRPLFAGHACIVSLCNGQGSFVAAALAEEIGAAVTDDRAANSQPGHANIDGNVLSSDYKMPDCASISGSDPTLPDTMVVVGKGTGPYSFEIIGRAIRGSVNVDTGGASSSGAPAKGVTRSGTLGGSDYWLTYPVADARSCSMAWTEASPG